MAFPISTINKIVLPNNFGIQSVEELVSNISAGLVKVKPSKLKVVGNEIEFSGGIFRFVWNTNILVPVSSGKIVVEKTGDLFAVTYELKFLEILLFASTIIPLFFGPVLFTKESIQWYFKIGFLVFAWLWLFGMNYLITIIRFPGFIKKISITMTGS